MFLAAVFCIVFTCPSLSFAQLVVLRVCGSQQLLNYSTAAVVDEVMIFPVFGAATNRMLHYHAPVGGGAWSGLRWNVPVGYFGSSHPSHALFPSSPLHVFDCSIFRSPRLPSVLERSTRLTLCALTMWCSKAIRETVASPPASTTTPTLPARL